MNSLDPRVFAILRELNVQDARKFLFSQTSRTPATDEIVLASIHKVRYERKEFTDEERHASRIWLQERGMSRVLNAPFLPEGMLP